MCLRSVRWEGQRLPGGAEGAVGSAVVRCPGCPLEMRCLQSFVGSREGHGAAQPRLGGTERQCLEEAVGQSGGRGWVGAEHWAGGRSSEGL